MDWCDIENILIDGTKEEISALLCPECHNKFTYEYGSETDSMEIRCKGCECLSRAYKFPFPNCVIHFGTSATV